VDFGEYGLKAVTAGWVSARQIEAARKTIAHYTKRGGRIFIRIFPDKPISKKPPETRMGSGKGDVAEFVAVVRPGRILFELSGIGREDAQEAMRRAGAKLPVRSIFVVKGA
jgi:large subunit ribosomal protein L16